MTTELGCPNARRREPAEVFARNLWYANGLISGGHSLTRLRIGILDPADLYLASIAPR